MKNNLEIEVEVRQGISKLYENINQSQNINEIKSELEILLNLIYRYASKQNNRHNKSLKVFQEYNKIPLTREQKIRKDIKNNNKTYKDYLSYFQILRARGLSFKKISEYAKAEFNIKVSSETIRNKLKELDNV